MRGLAQNVVGLRGKDGVDRRRRGGAEGTVITRDRRTVSHTSYLPPVHSCTYRRVHRRWTALEGARLVDMAPGMPVQDAQVEYRMKPGAQIRRR